MTLSTEVKEHIHSIWDSYIESDKLVRDTQNVVINDIDAEREAIIVNIKALMDDFSAGEINIHEFKTSIDSLNKRNNLWGFTAAKGQMFFNQLVKAGASKEGILTKLVIDVISEPENLDDAKAKIDALENFTLQFYNKADDKRKAPKPSSIGYFLSYFWQVHNPQKWPIIYTSLTNAYEELGIWEAHDNQATSYSYFFTLNEQVKQVLKDYTHKDISNWDAEHAFWNFSGNPNAHLIKKEDNVADINPVHAVDSLKSSAFEYQDYIMPKVADLINLGSDDKSHSSKKGAEYEKRVSEIFKYLDFEVEHLGQGKGRNPDAIIKFRKENIAFIVDAKAYSDGYTLGVDDRAIKEYISHYCPKLKNDGFNRIGFILVSNSYKSDFSSFINEITWETDIKRFILLTSEALLHLLAYKVKDGLSLSQIVESLVSFENPVEASSVNEEFFDV